MEKMNKKQKRTFFLKDPAVVQVYIGNTNKKAKGKVIFSIFCYKKIYMYIFDVNTHKTCSHYYSDLRSTCLVYQQVMGPDKHSIHVTIINAYKELKEKAIVTVIN